MQDSKKLTEKALNFHKTGEIKKALFIYKKLLVKQKNNSNLLYLVGTAYLQIGEYKLAIKFLKKNIEIDQNNLGAHNNLGGALQEINKFNEAIKIYSKLLKLKPDHLEAQNNIAVCYSNLKKYEEAIKIYKNLINNNPKNYTAYNNLGNVYKEMNLEQDAIKNYQEAIKLKSDYFISYKNLADIYKRNDKYKEAIQLYSLVNKIRPGYKDVIFNIIHAKLMICDWSGYEKFITSIRENLNYNKIINPFIILSLIDDAELQKKSSEIYINEKFYYLENTKKHKQQKKNLKPKIGYFSADFRNHATLHLIMDVFKNHDKSKFDFYAFSFGDDKVDKWNIEAKKYFKKFINVRHLSDIEISKLSQDIGIDIAIDLKGFTQDARPGIFFHKAAPIQVNYLGYPGTMGAKFIDYILADEIVIPKNNKIKFTEKIVYLKNCYQPNMNKREISTKIFSRDEFGLPKNDFVFCNFNSNYKITPDIFNLWINILKKVSNSVIWILASNSSVSENLKSEAKKRGVNENRIIFAKKLPINEHLKRIELADLFLDTFPYGAHTTASDAIRMGLPVITMIGESFCSRVAASILDRVSLNELIVKNKEDYMNLAINLANNKPKLKKIKNDLISLAKTSSLYDSKKFTKNLEVTYIKLLNR